MSSTVHATPLPEFTIISEEWKPYNFQENGVIKGISTDILILMLERTNSTQNRDDIKIYPWARSYKIAQKQPNTILFTTTRTEKREHMFKWVGPIFELEIDIYALKNRHIKIHSFDDLKKYKIGTTRKDVAEDLLAQKTGISILNFDRVSSSIQNMIKLSRGRVDLIAQSKEFTVNSCKEAGLNPDDFESVFILDKKKMYYAFNKETPDYVISTLQTAFDELKNEGKITEVFNNYGK